MLPAINFGNENDAAVCTPIQHVMLYGEAAGAAAGLIHALNGVRCNIIYGDCRASARTAAAAAISTTRTSTCGSAASPSTAKSAEACGAHEGDGVTVRRPARSVVAIRSRRDVTYFFFAGVINRDQTVAGAICGERKFLAVWRPFDSAVFSAHVNFGWFSGAANSFDPNFSFFFICDPSGGRSPVRRNVRMISDVHFLRRRTEPGDRPNRLIYTRRIACGVR